MFLVSVSYKGRKFFDISRKETLYAHYWAKSLSELIVIVLHLKGQGINNFKVYKVRESEYEGYVKNRPLI